MRCTVCGYFIDIGENLCSSCGTSVPPTRKMRSEISGAQTGGVESISNDPTKDPYFRKAVQKEEQVRKNWGTRPERRTKALRFVVVAQWIIIVLSILFLVYLVFLWIVLTGFQIPLSGGKVTARAKSIFSRSILLVSSSIVMDVWIAREQWSYNNTARMVALVYYAGMSTPAFFGYYWPLVFPYFFSSSSPT